MTTCMDGKGKRAPGGPGGPSQRIVNLNVKASARGAGKSWATISR